MASSASDRTINKIALCGAIFAGVAYVGYSVVKKTFGKTFGRGDKKKEDENSVLEYEPHRRGRIYLRRLSGSGISAAAAEIFLRNQDDPGIPGGSSSNGGLIIRPLSVQQRIKELNLRARHFAETILAVQLQDNCDRPPASASRHGHAISLQPSPMHTPRPLSPIDITHLGSSRCSSVENLSFTPTSGASSYVNGNGERYGSLRRRCSRRSSMKKMVRNPEMLSKEDLNEFAGHEAEKLLDEREAELRRRLQGFENGTTKVLTPYEAKSLVALLHSRDSETLERVLVTVANCAAFTTNQDHLREAGCLARLQQLISHPDLIVKMAAIRTAGNMSLNTANQEEMENFVPVLLMSLNDSGCEHDPDGTSDHYLLNLQTLATLTNIAALDNWHRNYEPGLTRVVRLSQSTNSKLRIQSLRLLINLSTNEEMIAALLNAKTLDSVCDLVETCQSEDELLRLVSLLSNLVTSASRLGLLNSQDDLDGLSAMNSKLKSLKFLSHLADLKNQHPNEDIRSKTRSVYTVLCENNNQI